VGEHVVAEQQVGREPRAARSSAVSRPKKRTSVGIPAASAAAATLAAGSTPSTGTPRATKWRSR